MIIEKLEILHTFSFKDEVNSGSSPIKFQCSDFNNYYVKLPLYDDYDDLIYEIIGYYLAKLFHINCPDISYINITENSYDLSFFKMNKNLIKPGLICFGSKEIINHEILSHLTSIVRTKKEFDSIANPFDIIKIGLFDFHCGNMDRSEQNFNLIYDLSFVPKKLIAIDHVAIFKGATAKNSFIPIDETDIGNNILKSSYSQSILKHFKKNDIAKVIEEYFSKIDLIPDLIEKLFSSLPKDWIYNDDLKDRVINFLINEKRNLSLKTEFHRFLSYK
jgi:hypothetical protein